MKSIPRTFKSYEADLYILPSVQCREMFKIIFNKFLRKTYKDISNIDPVVDANVEYLSITTGINRKTAIKYKSQMENSGLITAGREKIKIHLKHYLSLVFLFTSLDKEYYDNFSQYVTENNIEKLEEIGYRQITDEEAREMLIIILYSKIPKTGKQEFCDQESYVPKTVLSEKLSTENGTYENSYVPKTVLNENSYVPNLVLKEQLSTVFGTYGIDEDLTSQIWYLTQEEIKSYVPNLVLSGDNPTECLGKIVDNIGLAYQKRYGSDSEASCGQLGSLIVLSILGTIVYGNMRYVPNLGLNTDFLSTVFTHRIRNIYNNKKDKEIIYKEINNKENSYKDKDFLEISTKGLIQSERSEDCKKEKKEKKFFEPEPEDQELPAEKQEEQEGGLEIIELVEQKPFGEGYRKKRKESKQTEKLPALKKTNPYSCKPYLTPEEVKRFASDIAYDTESPARLFLYYFFDRMLDYYDQNVKEYPEGEFEEDGNDNEPEYDGPTIEELLTSSFLIKKSELDGIMMEAMMDVQDSVEKGSVELDYGDGTSQTFKINIPKDFQIPEADCMMDWKPIATIDGEEAFQFSLENIRDIDSQATEQIPEPRTKDEIKQERRRSHQMIAEIMKADKNILTPIEKVIRKFFDEFGDFDEYYHLTGFQSTKPMYIPGEGNRKGETIMNSVRMQKIGRQLFLNPVVTESEKAGIPSKLFFQALTRNESRLGGETISNMGPVFSYTKVANINLANHWNSQVIQQETQNKAI